jgi:hypothetical protein
VLAQEGESMRNDRKKLLEPSWELVLLSSFFADGLSFLQCDMVQNEKSLSGESGVFFFS